MARIVIALGGNALQENPKDISAKAQLETSKATAKILVDILELGHELIITHGNGPQVGQIVAAYEGAASLDKLKPIMPFPECGAMSQAYIGYHLQQAIRNEITSRAIMKEVATVITEVKVNIEDEAFKNPTKPVGSFFSEEEAKTLEREKGYIMKADANRGYRRVVPSPLPLEIVEEKVIKTLLKDGHMVITVGGGGVPVIERAGMLEGIAAVIDKDFASEVLAEILEADILLILTAVDKVAVNYGREGEEWLNELSIEEAKVYMEEGHFAPGSMLPKIKAATKFASSKKGRSALITSITKAKGALLGSDGTKVYMK